MEDPTVEVKPWQVEDLSSVPVSTLFSRLQETGAVLDEQSYLLYAESADSPEDLLDLVWLKDEDMEGRDRAYLLLFELWKRLLPGRMALSVFCDALDWLIYTYDTGEMDSEEALQNALVLLEDVLDNSADAQGSPQEIFLELSSYCAHDLERFVFDYVSDQLESGNAIYASELIDAFDAYATDKKRFDFLRARLCMLTDVAEGNLLLERLLDILAEEPDLELLLTIGESLVRRGDVRLFLLSIRQALPLLQNEAQFKDILNMVADYFRCLDREEEEKKVVQLIDARSSLLPHCPLDASDQAIGQFLHLLKVLP